MQLQYQQQQQQQINQESETSEIPSMLPIHQTVFNLLSPVLFLVERFHRSANDETSICWSAFEIRMSVWLLHFFGIDGESMKLLRDLFSSIQNRVNRHSLLAFALGIGESELSKQILDVEERFCS